MTTEFKSDFNGKRIWMYWPGTKACQFKENVEKGFMACGLPDEHDIGDISKIGIRNLVKYINAEYGYTNAGAMKLMTEFYTTVQKGDFVIARDGFDAIVGIGIVTSDYYYDESRSDFRHCREVEWISTKRLPFPDEFKKGGKWHRVTNIDMPFRKIAEQLIIAICEGKDDGM